MASPWMAQYRGGIGGESPGRHFRQSCGVLIVFGVIFIHGNLWQETTGQLSEEYTSSRIVFNKSQERSGLEGRNRQIQSLSTSLRKLLLTFRRRGRPGPQAWPRACPWLRKPRRPPVAHYPSEFPPLMSHSPRR